MREQCLFYQGAPNSPQAKSSLSQPPRRSLWTKLMGMGKAKMILLLLVSIALLMSACGSQTGTTSGAGGSSSTPISGPHGLPGNIPLPNGATYVDQRADSNGIPDHEWVWTLASPNNPHTAQQFYQNNLPKNGWTIARSDASDPAGGVVMIGCQGNQEVDILLEPTTIETGVGTITAPSGGSVLDLQTLHGVAATQNGCGS